MKKKSVRSLPERVLSLVTLVAYVATMLPRTAFADTAPTSTASEVTQGQSGLGTGDGEGSASGALSGVSVEPGTGVLRSTYPFDSPHARGGVQPGLSLSYSSLGGLGVAGQGWDLATPSIVRHNLSGGPHYTDPIAPNYAINTATQDRFEFSGMPLIPICLVVGTTCTGTLAGEQLPTWANFWMYYRLEREDGTLMRFFWSPDHRTWRVQTKLGSILELGVAVDSPQELPTSEVDTNSVDIDPTTDAVFRWNISRQYDTHRLASGRPTNIIVYKWSAFPSGLGGQRAELTDVYDTPPITDAVRDLSTFAHHIHLNYVEQLVHPLDLQSPLWKVQSFAQLQNVDVTSNDFNGDSARYQARRFWLSYAYVDTSTNSLFPNPRLSSIQVEGTCAIGKRPVDGALSASPGVCPTHPPEKFGYTLAGATPKAVLIGALPETMGVPTPSLLDVNSDGLTDILVSPVSPKFTTQSVMFNSPATLGNFATSLITVSGGTLSEVGSTLNPNSIQYNVGSFAMTGSVDLLWFGAYGAQQIDPAIHYDLFRPSQTSTGWLWSNVASSYFTLYQAKNSPSATPGIVISDEEKYASVDLDGDGYTDLVTTADYGPVAGIPQNVNARLLGSRFTQVSPDGSVLPFSRDPGIQESPTNLLLPNTCVGGLSQNAQLFNSSTSSTMADYNGDGLPDWIQLTADGVTVWPGHGDGMFGTCPDNTVACTCATAAGTSVLAIAAPANLQAGHFDDVTGDGRADLIIPSASGFTVYPNNFVTGIGETSVPVSLTAAPISWTNLNGISLTFADMDGNGVDDIVVQNPSGALNLPAIAYVDVVGADLPGLLNKIDNGLGGVTSITYAPTATLQVGQGWTSTTPQSIHVVTSVQTTNSLPSPDVTLTNYTYANPVFDPRDRQFIGFQNVIEEAVGDSDGPSSYVSTNYYLGVCVNNPDQCGAGNADYPWRSVRGLPILTEAYTPGPAVAAGRSPSPPNYLMTTHRSFAETTLYAGLDGRAVHLVQPTAIDTWSYGQSSVATPTATSIVDVSMGLTGHTLNQAASFNVEATPNVQSHVVLKGDAFGNLIESDDFGHVSGGSSLDGIIQSHQTWAVQADDSGGNWMWRPTFAQTQGVDATLTTSTSTPRSQTITYDTEGNPKLVTSPLSGTLPLQRFHQTAGASVAPAPTGASATSGTVTVAQTSYDSAGNAKRIQGAGGRCTDVSYDAYFDALPTLTETYVSGCGSAVLASMKGYDGTLGLVLHNWAPDGSRTDTAYDGFGNVTGISLPDPTKLGSTSSAYIAITTSDIAGAGRQIATSVSDSAGNTTQSWRYLDGFGRFVGGVSSADTKAGDPLSYIQTPRPKRSAKGVVVTTYPPVFSGTSGTSANYAFGTGASKHVSNDAFGRPLQTVDLDGTVTSRLVYGPQAVQMFDAEQLKASGPHVGAYSTIQYDGHGRTAVVTKVSATAGNTVTAFTRQPTGEVTQIAESAAVGGTYTRWMQYDSLGRLVLNAEPNTSTGFSANPASAGAMKAWRYAYDDAGDLVGTSDARGCGENLAYDGVGRLVSEDYSPCLAAQQPYTAPGSDGVSTDGLEVLRVYDHSIVNPVTGDGAPSFVNDGKLYAVNDRASLTQYAYDSRSRVTAVTRSIARPGSVQPVPQLHTLYESLSSTATFQYDALNRNISTGTGADQADLMVNGASNVTTTYSARGTIKSVQGSYGTLVASTAFAEDGLPIAITYGDTAKTQSTFNYDGRRRLSEMKTSRAALGLWTSKGSATYTAPNGMTDLTTMATVLTDDVVASRDAVGNPTEIDDHRIPSEWQYTEAIGSAPVWVRTMGYDDSYRLTAATYEYHGFASIGPDAFVSPTPAATASMSPLPVSQLANRVNSQSYQYDGLGNMISSTDDQNAFFDRSLGTISNGNTSGVTGFGPNQIASATQTGANGGLLNASYDAAGNLVQLAVNRSATCVGGADCSQLFHYDWDEVGQLARARRYDFEGGFGCGIVCIKRPLPTGIVYPALPTFAATADVTYTYDAGHARVLRASTQADGTTAYSAEIFPSLRLEQTSWNGATTSYVRNDATEAVYLASGGGSYGRVVHDATLQSPSGNARHVYLELGDALGSTTTLVDQETSEVVERTTYMAFGQVENDTRSDRWESFRDPYKYTGKEDDLEIGLTYYGARYYSPQLSRWASADPMTIHGVSSDLDPYAYANNSPLSYVDPTGLVPTAGNTTGNVSGCDENGGQCGSGGPLGWVFGALALLGLGIGFGVTEIVEHSESPPTPMPPGEAAVTAAANNNGSHPGVGTSAGATAPVAAAQPMQVAAFDPWANSNGFTKFLMGNSAVANWLTDDSNLAAVQDVATAVTVQASMMAATAGIGSIVEGIGGLAAGFINAARAAEAVEAGVGTGEVGAISALNPTGCGSNCVNAAIAVERTLAGAGPMSALPSAAVPVSEVPGVLENALGKSLPSMDVAGRGALTSILSSMGNGSRAILYGTLADGNIHAINAVYSAGRLILLDGQAGTAGTMAGMTGIRVFFTTF